MSALSVVALLCGFAALSFWIRRLSGERPPRRIRVIERQRLDAQHSVWLVRLDDRELLLGSGRDGLRRLTPLGDEAGCDAP